MKFKMKKYAKTIIVECLIIAVVIALIVVSLIKIKPLNYQILCS